MLHQSTEQRQRRLVAEAEALLAAQAELAAAEEERLTQKPELQLSRLQLELGLKEKRVYSRSHKAEEACLADEAKATSETCFATGAKAAEEVRFAAEANCG